MLRGVPGAAAVGAATLLAEAVYTVNRRLPSFAGHDASTHMGPVDAPPLAIVALGDSTLTGPGLRRPEDIWIRQSLARLDGRYRISLQSLAEGGSRTRDVLRRQVPAMGATDIAVLVVGSNDALHGTSVRSVEHDLRACVRALLERSKAMVLAGVGDLGSIPRMPTPLHSVARSRGRAMDRIIARVADEDRRIEKVDMWDLTATRFQREADTIFADDLFHPNALGHRIWADAFYPSLVKAIRTAGR